MYKGIYIVLSGTVLKQAQMDVISQNLANADTVGYKKNGILFRDYLFKEFLKGLIPTKVMSDLS